ncbi:MAG: DoxX family membrane protein [Patescibacteria group bacterium]|nr:DoxX family membrane protein [Patescibacteria group bacterium]
MKPRRQHCPGAERISPLGSVRSLARLLARFSAISLPGNRLRMSLGAISSSLLIAMPSIASAHEVYVLTQGQIRQAIGAPSFSLVGEAMGHIGEFAFWAFIGALVVGGVFWISILRFLERRFDPMLVRARRYATLIARITIGISFVASAWYQATYGPELPLVSNFGPWSGALTLALAAIGVLTIVGLYARTAALVGLAIFGAAVWQHGSYMLTYANYLGEMIVLLILGAHEYSLDSLLARRSGRRGMGAPAWLASMKGYLAPRSFAILRVLFGVALIYASYYAKILHNNLALFTVDQYHLDKILGFEPHFLVLGAAIVELLIGTFFILGIEIRFTALFFLFWLTLSLIFFGEAVWPHLILIGIPIAYLFYGYDDYSLEGWFFRKKKYEPVL